MTELRSRNGCWTCRLRRRKCDEARPQCRECKSRNLACHGYGEKPKWMDGGARQRAELASIKHAVSNEVQQRRFRLQANRSSFQQPLDVRAHPAGGTEWSRYTPGGKAQGGSGLSTPTLSSVADEHEDFSLDKYSSDTFFSTDTESIGVCRLDSGDVSNTSNSTPTSILDPNTGTLANLEPGSYMFDVSTLEEVDLAFPPIPPITVFPQTHALPPEMGITCMPRPPPTLLPGLDLQDLSLLIRYLDEVFLWQFPFLTKQGSVLHKSCILRLVSESYPLTLAIQALTGYFIHESSKESNNAADCASTQLARQYQGALQEFRRALQAHQQTSQGASDCGWVMGSVLVLTHTSIIRGDKDWRSHLRAAAPMLTNLLFHKTQQCQEHGIVNHEHHASNFLINAMIWLHVLASLSNDEEEADVPGPSPEQLINILEDKDASVQLENVTGCKSWVLACILKIQALYRWKEDAIANKSLNIWELTQAASSINHKLNIEPTQQSMPECLSDTITHVYTCAATIFLEVVVSGDFPRLSKIRDTIAHMITALDNIQDAGILRILAWPLCVAGSMAEPGLYPYFEILLVRHSSADEILENVLELLRTVWTRRRDRDASHGSNGVPWIEAMKSLDGGVFFM